MIQRLKSFSFRRLFALGDPRWGQQGGAGEPEPAKGASASGDSQGQPSGQSNEPGGNEPPRDPPPPQRPRNEPPDLDEVWKDFNRRLSGLFGGKGGGNRGGGFGNNNNRRGNGGGGSGFKAPNMKTGPIFGAVTLGALLLWLASGFYIVQEGQASLVLRFGEYRTSASAGFQWRMPAPIESHEIVDLAQIRQITVGVRGSGAGTRGRDSLMLTRDENIVDLQFAVQYRVGDPKDYLFNNVATDEIVAQAAETAMREVVGRSLSDTVLYENKEGIAREALALIQGIADRYSSGLSIVDVTIQNVQPPDEVQAAFSDAIRAGQDAERLKNEGQAYANDVIPRARGSAERLIQEAEGYRERVIATSLGDAERFRKIVVEYNKAPAVTRERMYLETMQQVFSNVSKVMVDSRANNNLLYLPLDKLIQQGAVGPGAAGGAPPTMGATAFPSPAANGVASNAAATANESSAPPVADRTPAPSLRDRLREAR
jgi:modulator of FtsH protease HflK